MKKIQTLGLIVALISMVVAAHAQTNTPPATNAPAPPASTVTPPATVTPSSAITLLQSYLVDNDPTCNVWQSNHFDIWQAAVFQNVNGTPGASAVGNVLGLEVPVWRTTTRNTGLHIESMTDFEQLFGDVGWQGFGLGYDYNIHQVQISFNIDGDIALHGPMTFNIAPGLEFKKASTSLGGISPLFRWQIPIRKQTGWGQILVGAQLPF